MAEFKGASLWMKSSWVLVTIGFVVWLAAGGSFFSTSVATNNAFDAFLIIGVVTYYGCVMLTFLFMFVADTAGNRIVLIVNIVLAFIAGISAIIVLSIGQYVNFSDRMAYSAICAIVTGVFCILEFVGTRNLSGRGGVGGGGSGGGGSGEGDVGVPTHT